MIRKLKVNPHVQEDRLRRWSEDVVDHRLRDSVRLAKLYREGIVSSQFLPDQQNTFLARTMSYGHSFLERVLDSSRESQMLLEGLRAWARESLFCRRRALLFDTISVTMKEISLQTCPQQSSYLTAMSCTEIVEKKFYLIQKIIFKAK